MKVYDLDQIRDRLDALEANREMVHDLLSRVTELSMRVMALEAQHEGPPPTEPIDDRCETCGVGGATYWFGRRATLCRSCAAPSPSLAGTALPRGLHWLVRAALYAVSAATGCTVAVAVARWLS